MEQCSMCLARFEKKWMKGHRCHECDKVHGQEGDREKLLKESNPELYPAHEYVDVKVYDELVERVAAVEKQLASSDVVPDEVTPPKRGSGRPKSKVEGDKHGK